VLRAFGVGVGELLESERPSCREFSARHKNEGSLFSVAVLRGTIRGIGDAGITRARERASAACRFLGDFSAIISTREPHRMNPLDRGDEFSNIYLDWHTRSRALKRVTQIGLLHTSTRLVISVPRRSESISSHRRREVYDWSEGNHRIHWSRLLLDRS